MCSPQDQGPSKADREQLVTLGEQIAEQAAQLDSATHRLLADIRTFDQAGGWQQQGARSCAEWLSWRLGWSGNTAREHVRVASRLGDLPQMDASLSKGELSYCKVRAMTRVATPTNEELLLADARHATGIQLEQICRKYAVVQRASTRSPEGDHARRSLTKHELDDGMVRLDAVLLADEAALVWEALTNLARERAATTPAPGTHGNAAGQRFSRVDALVELAHRILRGDAPDRSPIELVVTVSAETLAEGKAETPQAGRASDDGGTEQIGEGATPDSSATRSSAETLALAVTADGTCLSAHTAQRLACDAGIVLLVEDAQGRPLSVGRKTRSIPAAIKRALLRRDRGCRFPGCTNRLFVDGHHVVPWAGGGETALANLVTLCGFHHRHVHEYGYRVVLDAEQHPQFFDPEGVLVPEVPPHEVHGALPLRDDIDARSNGPHSDERRPNYAWIVEDLARADGLDADALAFADDVSAETTGWPSDPAGEVLE